MPIVRLGNPAALDRGMPLGAQVTTAHVDPNQPLGSMMRDLFHDDGGPHTGMWAVHSAAPGPSWVESDDPELEAAIAAKYGCPIGEPPAVVHAVAEVVTPAAAIEPAAAVEAAPAVVEGEVVRPAVPDAAVFAPPPVPAAPPAVGVPASAFPAPAPAVAPSAPADASGAVVQVPIQEG